MIPGTNDQILHMSFKELPRMHSRWLSRGILASTSRSSNASNFYIVTESRTILFKYYAIVGRGT
jgi:hypothetical protein